MIVLKSTHKALLAASEEAHKADCNQFEARISELRHHIESLKRLVFSPTIAQPTPIAREADAIITPVNDGPIIGSQDDPIIADEILREQNRIFSGEWEEVIA